MKKLVIDFLIEEAKFLSTAQKEAQKKFLMTQSEMKLFDMLLEKSRNQGEEQAFLFYQDKIEKGKI